MDLTIRSHHVTVFPGFQDHAQRKLARLERLLPRLGDVVIEVEHEVTRAVQDRFAVSITARAGPTVLRATERGADPKAALEAAIDAVTLQARRDHDRKQERHHAHGLKETAADRINEAAPPEEPGDGDERRPG